MKPKLNAKHLLCKYTSKERRGNYNPAPFFFGCKKTVAARRQKMEGDGEAVKKRKNIIVPLGIGRSSFRHRTKEVVFFFFQMFANIFASSRNRYKFEPKKCFLYSSCLDNSVFEKSYQHPPFLLLFLL